jgi:hypothetical protein
MFSWIFPRTQSVLQIDKPGLNQPLNDRKNHRGRNSVRQQCFLSPSGVCAWGAYLAAGQGRAAATEFQKILNHSGIVGNCWTGALAHLGVARALQGADADGARVRTLAAYKDFLGLWEDADSDIPILTQAKAEYAKLN